MVACISVSPSTILFSAAKVGRSTSTALLAPFSLGMSTDIAFPTVVDDLPLGSSRSTAPVFFSDDKNRNNVESTNGAFAFCPRPCIWSLDA